MKKTTLFLGISLTMLLGCSKKDCNQPNPAAPVQGSSQTFYKLNLNGSGTNAITSVSIPLAKLQNNSVATSVTPHQAIGHFTIAPGGPTSLSDIQNVVSNNGGIHGHISWTGRFGVEMDAVCLQVVGNAGICSGLITSVSNDFGLPEVFAVGNIIIFAVIDNGEGANAPLDQVNDAIFYWPASYGAFPCGEDFSQLPWSYNDDIVKGGQIQVK